jgi:hypothetical protein
MESSPMISLVYAAAWRETEPLAREYGCCRLIIIREEFYN